MTFTDDWRRVPLSSIKVDRAKRQRRNVRDPFGRFLDSDGLLASISARGVMNAVIVEEREGELWLRAGERRLEASRELNLPDIPVRLISSLPETELYIIEFEENLKRLDLNWRDEVAAVAELHRLYCSLHPKWTLEATAKSIGYSQVPEALRVARDLDSPRIAAAGGVRAAYNILARIDERVAADVVNDIIDAGADIFSNIGGGEENGDTRSIDSAARGSSTTSTISDKSTVHTTGGSGTSSTRATTPTPEDSIRCADALEFFRTYTGPTFSFIHCDFPYGIGVFSGALSGRDANITYDDSKKTYLTLCRELCEALPRIMSHSAHLMFWLSADIQIQHSTLEIFREHAPQLRFNYKPLIWHKTDNVGIIANPKQDPRHVYETALFARTEERQLVRSVSDTYGAPTDKLHHPSTKPEPMLRHFFQMFVDNYSKILDPTCGGGSALRAAESLGAPYVLGLEKDEEHCKNAQSALRSFRTLRKVSR